MHCNQSYEGLLRPRQGIWADGGSEPFCEAWLEPARWGFSSEAWVVILQCRGLSCARYCACFKVHSGMLGSWMRLCQARRLANTPKAVYWGSWVCRLCKSLYESEQLRSLTMVPKVYSFLLNKLDVNGLRGTAFLFTSQEDNSFCRWFYITWIMSLWNYWQRHGSYFFAWELSPAQQYKWVCKARKVQSSKNNQCNQIRAKQNKRTSITNQFRGNKQKNYTAKKL